MEWFFFKEKGIMAEGVFLVTTLGYWATKECPGYWSTKEESSIWSLDGKKNEDSDCMWVLGPFYMCYKHDSCKRGIGL